MNFNHPVKEVVWVFQRAVNAPQNGGNVATNDWFNFSTSDPGETEPAPYTGDLMHTGRQAAKIQLNSHDRFSPRSALYFRLVQPKFIGHKSIRYKANTSLFKKSSQNILETWIDSFLNIKDVFLGKEK